MIGHSLIKINPAVRRLHQTGTLFKGDYSHLTLTFFGKPNCGLCDAAKEVIDDVLTENRDLTVAKIKLKQLI